MAWRNSAIWTGIGIIVVGLPCATLLKNRPEAYGLHPDGDTPGKIVQSAKGARTGVEYNFTLREAVHTRAFWFLAFGWTVTSFGIGVVQVHLFLDLGQTVGFSRPEVALVWSIAAITNIPARLLGGILGDRWPKNITLGIATLFMACSVVALAFTRTLPMAILFAVPYGIGWGISTPVMNSAQGEYFGRKSLGSIRGWLQMVSLPFSIVAPIMVGFMADRQGTYQWAFTIIAVFMLAGAGFMFMAKHPKLPHMAEST
jgi:MFS family permease